MIESALVVADDSADGVPFLLGGLALLSLALASGGLLFFLTRLGALEAQP